MKKIDTSKSLIFDSEVDDMKTSLEYINQEGYFSNSNDFSEYEEGKLDMVRVANFVFCPFGFTRDGNTHVFSYFIPKSKVVFVEKEPKTLRPFKSTKEFFDTTGLNIGEVVHIRKFAKYIYEETSNFNGVRVYIDEEFHRKDAIFGASTHSFDELFKYFKYYKNGKWLPFGIEE